MYLSWVRWISPYPRIVFLPIRFNTNLPCRLMCLNCVSWQKYINFLLVRDSREHRQNAGQCYNHEDKKDTQSNKNETRQFTDSYHVLAQDGLLSYHGPRYHRQDIWSEKPVVTPETPRPGVSIKWSFRLIKRWNKYPTTRADTWHDFPLRLVLRTRGQQSIPARLFNA